MAKPNSPQTGEPVHDVLAAEAFEMPSADPDLHRHGPVVLPEDPSGNLEPHDILAAEEFAMPAPRPAYHPAELAQRRGGWHRLAVEVLGALIVLRVLARRRSRRS